MDKVIVKLFFQDIPHDLKFGIKINQMISIFRRIFSAKRLVSTWKKQFDGKELYTYFKKNIRGGQNTFRGQVCLYTYKGSKKLPTYMKLILPLNRLIFPAPPPPSKISSSFTHIWRVPNNASAKKLKKKY